MSQDTQTLISRGLVVG
ncbi:hypothetical protein RSAG8_05204, partial [Rhizoctonia solani AG-8 WAC10335]